MQKSIGKLIFWCLLGVLTVICSASANFTVTATPERSVGENRGSLKRLQSDVIGAERASLQGMSLNPEPATLTVLLVGALAVGSMRMARKYRNGMR